VTKLTLARHGCTDFNEKGTVHGWKNVPLNEKGKKQAEELGRSLRGKGIDVVLTSDLDRAQSTAEEVGKAAQVPVETSKDLRPWNIGKHAGNPSKAVSSVMKDYARNRPDESLPGGESLDSFRSRFLEKLENSLKEHAGKHVVLVMHRGGDRLFAAWTKAGMSADHNIDTDTFLNWKDVVEPGKSIEVEIPSRSEQPSRASNRDFARSRVASLLQR
jgi:broad specificity phosphatase PhoE